MAGTRLFTQLAFTAGAAILLVLLSLQQGFLFDVRSAYNCYNLEPLQNLLSKYGAQTYNAAIIADAVGVSSSSLASSPQASPYEWSKTRWRKSLRISFVSLQEVSGAYGGNCSVWNLDVDDAMGCSGLSRRRLIQRVISKSIAALNQALCGSFDDQERGVIDAYARAGGADACGLAVQSHLSRRVQWLDGSLSIDLPKILDDTIPNKLKVYKQWPHACPQCVDIAIYLYEAPDGCAKRGTSGRDASSCAVKGIKSESQKWSKRVIAVSESVDNNGVVLYQVSWADTEASLASELVSAIRDVIRSQFGLPDMSINIESGAKKSINRTSSRFISADELMWMHAAYISRVLNSAAVADTLASLHCENVLHWSTEMHNSQYLFKSLNRIHELYNSIVSSLESNRKNKEESSLLPAFTMPSLLSRAVALDDELTRFRSNPDMHPPSMFPVEYRFALHAPFWIPILLPMLYGLASEYKRYVEKRRGRMGDPVSPTAELIKNTKID